MIADDQPFWSRFRRSTNRSMLLPSRSRTLLGILAAVVAILGFFRLRDRVDPPTISKAPVNLSPKISRHDLAVRAPTREEAGVGAVATLTPAILAPQKDSVTSATVQELLPEVTGPIASWKDFKPQKITIAPYPDMPIAFEMTSI